MLYPIQHPVDIKLIMIFYSQQQKITALLIHTYLYGLANENDLQGTKFL